MMHNIVYILIVLISSTFADVTFVTKPPEEVRTFPGQQVTLPCAVENLTEHHGSIRWLQIENFQINTISNNRDVFLDTIENVGNFSIIGDGMNFTLLITIPNSIHFGIEPTVTTIYKCSLVEPNGSSAIESKMSKVIIQNWTFQCPICGKVKTYYVIGETITLACYDSNATIITTLRSGNGKVLPTYLDKSTSSIIHNVTLTKRDHNAMFIYELRRNGTNEMRSCPIGPITVNYKPEIIITQISATEFHCTAEARPPVNVTHWIMKPSIPKDSFTISNGILTIIKPLKLESEMKITCEAENVIGEGNTSLSIPAVNSRDEEDGSSIIPTVNTRDEEDGFDRTLVIIVAISVLFCVVVAFLIIFLFLRRKRIKHQHLSKSRNMSAKFRSDDPQVELKNEAYDYAAVDVNEFSADYQETENEVYVGGDMLSSDDTNVANKKQSNTKLKDLDQIRDKVNRAQPNTDCEGLKNEQQVCSQVNKPDYKECENQIYQGPE